MATDYTSQLKKAAKTSLVKSFLGTGVVGRVAMKSFAGKEKQQDPVTEALDEQAQLQNDVNATIMRMESVVVNIADNVYNIAAVWSERVASMKEAKREQQERLSKEQAALEETENETARMLAPLPSGTDASSGGNKDISEKGLLSKLFESVTGTKSLLRLLMSKMGLVVGGVAAAGAIAGGAGLVGAMRDANEQGVTQTQEPPLPEIVLPGVGEAPPPAETARESFMRSEKASYGGLTAAEAPSTGVGTTSGAVPGTTSTPGGLTRAPFSGSSGSSDAQMTSQPTITSIPGLENEFQNFPEAREPASGTGGSLNVTGSYGPGSGGDSGDGGVSGGGSAAGGLAGAVGTTSAPAGGLSGASPGVSGSAGGLSGAVETSSSLSPMSIPSVPSSGADIGSMSRMNVSTGTATQAPVVVNTSTATQSEGPPQENPPLPSPIADRGSLDLNVFFKARYA